jgi:hypothetical protein
MANSRAQDTGFGVAVASRNRRIVSVPAASGADRTTDYSPVRIGHCCDVLLQARSADRNGEEEAVSRSLATRPDDLVLALLGLALGWLPVLRKGPIAAAFDVPPVRGEIAIWAGV